MFDFLHRIKSTRRETYRGSARQTGLIVGTGRCGTTILAQVLNAHSKICVPPELQFIIRYGVGDRLYEKYRSGELRRFRAKHFIKLVQDYCPSSLEKYFDYVEHFKGLSYPQEDMRIILRDFFDHICYSFGMEIFIEQTPWHGQFLNELAAVLPDMKVIHIVRDGRDVAISYAKTPWWSRDIHENIVQWEREALAIHRYGSANPGNFVEIRYEDLVLNPRRELERILSHFDVSFEDGMLDPGNLIDYLSYSRVNSIDYQSDRFKKWQGSKGKVFFEESLYAWKKRNDANVRRMTERVRNTLSLFGYEAD